MADVSIRELRNRGGDVVERAQRGERRTITRDGTPVAQLIGLPRSPVQCLGRRQMADTTTGGPT